MYTAFWLWAVAQALLLPNWIAGLSGLVGFGTLYFMRIEKEERLMLETFGEAFGFLYDPYQTANSWVY